MESETPADIKIFFKDKQNELKGPYTERQVQDWYRQNWFESSFPFYFMTGNERPTDQTEFLTLDTLRTLNGVGCPFAPVKPESNSEKIEEKIAKLDKELADLSKKCDGVKNLEKRLEDVEKRLKELSTQPPPTSNSSTDATTLVTVKDVVTAVKKPEKQPEENIDHAKLANAWAAYYLDVLEAYKTNNWDKVDGQRADDNMYPLLKVGESEPLRDKCHEVLLKKLMELDYVFCSECDAIFHNFEQILLHTTEPKHLLSHDALHQIQRGVNEIMKSIFSSLLKRLKKADQKQLRKALNNFAFIDPASPDLRPLLSFSVGYLGMTYGDAVFDYAGDVDSTRWQIVAKMIPRFKQNDSLGRKMLSEVHEHIGDRQTSCVFCKMATGSRREYYKHVRTNAHLMNSNAMDLITLVVNMFMNETD